MTYFKLKELIQNAILTVCGITNNGRGLTFDNIVLLSPEIKTSCT